MTVQEGVLFGCSSSCADLRSERQTCSVHWSPVWSWGSAGSRLNWSSATPRTAGRCSERSKGSREKAEWLWNTLPAQSGRWTGLLPGRSVWGCGAGSTSLVWCPGTPESSSSPLLPVPLSLPTDPESNRIWSPCGTAHHSLITHYPVAFYRPLKNTFLLKVPRTNTVFFS